MDLYLNLSNPERLLEALSLGGLCQISNHLINIFVENFTHEAGGSIRSIRMAVGEKSWTPIV
jgi:hypothetical protein